MDRLRRQLFAHLQRLDLSFYDRTPAGRVLTRVTTDIDALNELLASGLVTILGDLLTLGFITFVMFQLSPGLTLLMLAGCAGRELATRDADSGEGLSLERALILASAEQALGTPYRAGGNTSTGLDCSGLVELAYRSAGIAVPRTDDDQYRQLPEVRQDRPGRLEGVALRPVRGQEGKADVRVVERIALEHAAHADLGAVGLAQDAQQPVPVARVAGDGPLGDVPARVLRRAHAAVADVAQERGLVQETHHEFRVVVGELPELEPLGGEWSHWCSAQNGSTVLSTKDIRR